MEMTRREFQLLRALASRPGEVVTRDQLLEQVWGLESYPTTRTIDNHIAGLRAKLERDAAEPGACSLFVAWVTSGCPKAIRRRRA